MSGTDTSSILCHHQIKKLSIDIVLPPVQSYLYSHTVTRSTRWRPASVLLNKLHTHWMPTARDWVSVVLTCKPHEHSPLNARHLGTLRQFGG